MPSQLSRPETQRAIVLFPESDGLAGVEALRRRFDPLAAAIAAHVTVVFPFASTSDPAGLCAHVTAAARDFAPFAARFEGVSMQPDGYLFLNIAAGRAELERLHGRLYAGLLDSYRAPRHVYRPHITLGRFADPVALRAAYEEAASTRLRLDGWFTHLSIYRLGARGIDGCTELDVPLGARGPASSVAAAG
jgi:2'-5' RNA ligase